MSVVDTRILLPLTATMSSSKTRYGGRHNSLSLHVGGFHLAWLDANGDRFHQVHSMIASHGAGDHGHSGSKWTMDPKYSWSGYNLDDVASDEVMKALFGTSVVDELNRHLGAKDWVLFKDRYCLPREKLNRFIGSRCRDKTWCDAVWLKNAPASVAAHIHSLADEADEDVMFGEVRTLKPPIPPARERMRWRCEECSHEGHREAFKERYVPGLATSTGLNCPNCDYRQTDAITSLLAGPTRGSVCRLPSSIMYPGA
ncbi:hypothetical protein [Rhizobium rhizogenes]|uniref:hypothetical protein n=1 Tax=Rhizobium rhizogenes TaxID=359 RepID=UPI001571BFD1|nr:hypothetical protein [Rhizobium rhizogenes]NTG07225.1 hypothetical protein [Rhizobium rhizogenes]